MQIRRCFATNYFRITQESMDNPWNMPYMHFHNSYEIYILKTGRRLVTIDETEYDVGPHEATMFDINIPHTSRGDVPFSGICIHIPHGYLDIYFTPSAKNELLSCFEHSVIRLDDKDFETIQFYADSYKSDAKDNYLILANILNIMNKNASEDDILPVAVSKYEYIHEQIIHYVNDNYVYIKTISDLTHEFNVSESYIFKLFKKEFDMTPKQYINKLRIVNACHRLKYTAAPTNKVALQCGFDCYEYFVRVFKKSTGCTPLEYRKKNAPKGERK